MRLRIALAVFTLLFSLVVTQTTYTDWVIIDDFVTGNLNFCSFSSFNLADHLPKTCAATYDTLPDGSGGIIVGNQRDDQITISSGPSGTLVFTTIVIQGNFSCGTPAQSAGYAELQYDGIDNSMNLDVNGLGVQDFTAGGNAVQFHTIVASDTQTVMHVRVYSGGVIGGGLGDYCSYNFTIPGGNLFKEYLVDFGDFVPFGIGCDWTRVGAVDVTIDMINSADPIIAFLTTYGPVPTVTPTISVTASSSATPSVSISITSTRTPSITETPTISETPSISITPTQTVSPTASVSETPTPSISVSPSTSPTPSVSESASVSITPTPTISESETPTPTVSVTVTPTVTVSMSETPTRTVTVSVTKTVSVTVSESRTKSETPTQTTTRTRSVTASLSESPTRTASPTITVTPSITPTVTISVSTSRTPTITSSISKTGSWTRTRTTSISRSLIITPTPSATKTITASISKTGSPSRTAGASRSATRSPSHSRTPTVGAEVPIYEAVCPGTGKMTIDQAFDEAWHTSVASTGGCAHLATYKNEQEFKTLKAAMEEAGVDQAIIGARRQSDSSYQWGAGTIRGKNFVEPALSIAGRADCLQEFCLPNMNYVEPITSDDQVGMVLMLDYANNNVSHLIPSNGAECYVISYETFSYIPNVEGGAPYVLYPALADFDSHQNTAILNRQYLARVSSAQQNQWIQDELQCGTYNLWLGYETVTYPAATRALRLSAGSGDGTEILAAGSTTCKPGVYCNFAPAWLGVGGTDYAVSFASTTGLWSAIAQTTPQGAIRGRDICDAGVGYVDICVPSVYDTWHQTKTTTEALRLIASGSAFYAGGPYQKNIGGVNYIFYFDCMCNTYSHINLSCLAEDDPTSCQLYF